MVSDSWLTSKTKISLFADERVKGPRSASTTAKGRRPPPWQGRLRRGQERCRATSLERDEGVKSVKNDLQVVTPAARQAVDANDKDIAKAVETRLAKDLQLKKVDVRTDSGVVTLTGQVATDRREREGLRDGARPSLA
jgi:osmotically-inducible protein OsmY